MHREDLVLGDVQDLKVGKLFFNTNQRDNPVTNYAEIFNLYHFLETIKCLHIIHTLVQTQSLKIIKFINRHFTVRVGAEARKVRSLFGFLN